MHDAEGFRKFVAVRGRALSRAAYLLTGDHAKAEDLMQETLAKAAAKWRRVSAADDPEAYLKTMMINQLRTWHRPRRLVFFPTSQPPDSAAPPPDTELKIVLRHALTTSPRNSASSSTCASTKTCPRRRSPPGSAARSARSNGTRTTP